MFGFQNRISAANQIMPKRTTETAANECLDRDSLKKLKQHNRSILQKKMEQKEEAAIALREKLQQWKEEKKKKKWNEEQKKKPFVTVLKPAPPSKPLNAPPQSKPVVPRKSGVNLHAPPRNFTVNVAVPPCKSAVNMPAPFRKSMNVPASCTSANVPAPRTSANAPASRTSANAPASRTSANAPASRTSANALASRSSANAPASRTSANAPAKFGSIKTTVRHQPAVRKPSKPVAAVKAKPGPPRPQGGLLTATGQENQRPAARGVSVSVKAPPPTASKQPDLRHTTGGVTTQPPPHHHYAKKPTASEVATPLSGNTTGFGKRHMIADLTKGVEEGEEKTTQPMSLADELKTTIGVSAEAAVSKEVPTASTEPQNLSETFTADAGNLVSTLDNLSHRESSASDNGASASKPKGSSRDSLTSRFRKSKHQPSHPVKKSLGVTAASSKAMSPHIHPKTVGITGELDYTNQVTTQRAAGETTDDHQVLLKRRSGRKSLLPTTSTAARPSASVAMLRKSILKKPASPVQSSSSAEELGASPVLPPSQTKSMTAKDRPPVCVTGQGGVGGGKPAQATSLGHVAFTSPDAGKPEGEGAAYRKTPGRAKAQEYMSLGSRSKLNEWLAARGRTPVHLRHATCFHGCGVGSEQQRLAAPRSQMKASLSVDQLSRQEKVLAQSDLQSIRKRLEWTGDVKGARGFSCRSSSQSSQPSQPGARTSLKRETVRSQEVGSGEGSAEGSAVVKAGALSPGTSASPVEGGGGAGSPRVDIHHADSTPEQLQAEYQKCLTALETGLMSPEEALEWLDMVWEAREGCVRCDAQWYRCRVWALKKMGDEDAVLAAFEQAIIHGAQPVEEMAQLLTATMKELLAGQQTAGRHRRSSVRAICATRTASKRPLSCGPVVHGSEGVHVENMFQSTMVRFSVKEVTPFKKRRRTGDEEERLVSVVTPVRRSARLSSSTAQNSANKGRLPPGTPHMVAEYSALEEVPSGEKERMLYLPNRALGAMLNDTSPEITTEELDTSSVAMDE